MKTFIALSIIWGIVSYIRIKKKSLGSEYILINFKQEDSTKEMTPFLQKKVQYCGFYNDNDY